LRHNRLSAEQANGEGVNALGDKYEFGTGVSPNLQTAIDWYCRAIAQGNPRALNNVAILYSQDIGVPRDPGVARDLWRQWAERGHPNSAYNLGVSLLAAPGASEDKREGLLWLRRAAMVGQAAAQQQLRAMGFTGPFPVPYDSAVAMTILPRDMKPGHAPACGAPIS
jgi:TPR repeat protein